jgi:hypothetical protein
MGDSQRSTIPPSGLRAPSQGTGYYLYHNPSACC